MVHNAYSSYETVYLPNISTTYPKSADLKITQNGTLNCPIKYLVETFPGDFIGVQNYKNTLTDKKPGPIITLKRVISYLFNYMNHLFLSNKLWLCGAQKTRADKIIWDLP